MAYQPIENYGIIGDLNTSALVGIDGSIDFMCYPHFDSPSIFGALLDAEKGGHFSIKPVKDDIKHKQMYIPDTNVLLTRFLSSSGVGEITDFMPVEEVNKGNTLVRRVKTVRGEMTYRMECKPRFNYGRSSHRAIRKDGEIQFVCEDENSVTIVLKSNIPLEIVEGDGFAEFTLPPCQIADFIFEGISEESPSQTNLDNYVEDTLLQTANYWRNWIAKSKYQGRWHETVNRSALVLKLLTSFTNGSIVAAATFGLPEKVGGSFNWDYRYTWIRDAAFTVFSLIRLGYTKEARNFMNWVEKLCENLEEGGFLNLMYAIDGSEDLEEIELSHFEGYRGSSPVRIGNAAYKQVQLDIYGELMDSVYLYNKYGDPISYNFWKNLSRQIDWLCDHWKDGDQGIWEVRGGKRQFLYSTMMGWVALDRAMRLSYARSFPLNPKWKETRDEIYNTIFNDFWNPDLKAFVQYKGADRVDASTLLMPLIRFISPKDPKWLSTLNVIEEQLVSDSLVYRYRADKSEMDDLVTGEGTFSICSFWFVECLSRSGQLEKARFYFEKMLGYSNHLGLYSEQLGQRGEHLGNFPQAFTHLSLITAALNLNDRLNDARNRGID